MYCYNGIYGYNVKARSLGAGPQPLQTKYGIQQVCTQKSAFEVLFKVCLILFVSLSMLFWTFRKNSTQKTSKLKQNPKKLKQNSEKNSKTGNNS